MFTSDTEGEDTSLALSCFTLGFHWTGVSTVSVVTLDMHPKTIDQGGAPGRVSSSSGAGHVSHSSPLEWEDTGFVGHCHTPGTFVNLDFKHARND